MADDDERKTNPRADEDEGYDLELSVHRWQTAERRASAAGLEVQYLLGPKTTTESALRYLVI